ncbi:MAG: hypothetical protein KA521_08395 [Crocinitomicaceae bacterium]|nr:hypothetical protein [Crocinitomicaceae bacterium]
MQRTNTPILTNTSYFDFNKIVKEKQFYKTQVLSEYKNFDTHSTAFLVAHHSLAILYNNTSFQYLVTKKGYSIKKSANVLDFFKQFLSFTSYSLVCDVIVRKESKVIKNAFEIDSQMYAISIHTELNGNFHFIFYKSTKTSEESNTINLLGTTFPNLPIIQFELEMNLDRKLQFKAISSNSEKIIPLFDVKKGIENSAYFLDKIDESDRQSFFDSCEKALLNDQIWQNEFKFIAEDGCVFHFSINAKFYISDTGTFHWFGFLENITSKKEFDREKSALIYHTLDYERARFSMELHDGLAQYLVGLNLYIQQIETNDSNNLRVVEKCKSLLQDSINQTRALCYNLSPPELDNGFLNALNALFDRLNGINNVHFSVFIAPEITDEKLHQFDAYNVFRIIQEAINNSLKYAKCTSIDCVFKIENSKQVIIICDNGIGFDMDVIQQGLGLKNMEQRARIAKVNYTLTTQKNSGTSIQLEF